jgi:hypothetical protein
MEEKTHTIIDIQENAIDPDLLCPITGALMIDPVNISSGNTYL